MAERKKRGVFCERHYSSDGKEFENRRSPFPDTTAVRLVFPTFDAGEPITIELDALSDEVQRQCMAFGLVEKITNAAGGKKELAEKYEAIESAIENLLTVGWTAATEGGPRVGLLVEAYVAAATAAGKEVSVEETMKKLSALDEGQKEEWITKAKGNAKVMAAFERLRLERQQERLAKAEERLAADDEEISF